MAWTSATAEDREIYIKRFNGTDWEEVGPGSASNGGLSDNSEYSYSPDLALDGLGNPVVVWSDISSGRWEIYLKRFHDNIWSEVPAGSASGGGLSNSLMASTKPTLGIHLNGRICVAWSELGAVEEQIVMRCSDP